MTPHPYANKMLAAGIGRNINQPGLHQIGTRRALPNACVRPLVPGQGFGCVSGAQTFNGPGYNCFAYMNVSKQRHVESFARQSGAQVTEPLCGFPGWQPDVSSKALAVLKEAHKEVMKRDARVYAVHAGLECGLIQAVYPKYVCVEVAPRNAIGVGVSLTDLFC